MRKFVTSLEKGMSKINEIAGFIAATLIVLMMILTFANVTGRYFIRPIVGTHELTYLSLALIVFLSLGYVQSKKEHIAIGIFVDKCSKRTQAVLDAISYFVTFSLLFLMGWQMVVFAGRTSTTLTGDLHLPVSAFVYLCALGAFLYAMTAVVDFLKSLLKVVNPEHES
ncbi:TRAP transporter small permease [Alkalihalobacillus oceani]|uniref:TRAP transporter small permease n=1 Tax=Halalkalibacter oceani TaxID=1653776 RepID=A0A9X2IMU6_9BACI|nr:TRAP transporter small permease [Halalkalibacter oceani]MCM3713360.1 TRAP transporter small permease [Halalkalibacter oceani]